MTHKHQNAGAGKYSMTSAAAIVLTCLSAMLALTPNLGAKIVTIQLPAETGSFKQVPGSELANGQCLVCHSVDYVVMQPPMKRPFWAAAVKKMREKFGASIPDDMVDPLVDYLTSTYGVVDTNSAASKLTAGTKTAPVSTEPATAETLAARLGCFGCHNVSLKIVGPAYKDVAAKYYYDKKAYTKITEQIHKGGAGKWGPVIMPPFPMVSDADAKTLAQWIMKQYDPSAATDKK